MLNREQIDRLLSEGANVLSADGEKIGSIGQVYVDNDDGQPSWVTVKTGLFGMSESFVPLEGARTEGDDIVVPYSKDQVKEAPRIESGRALEPAEEDRLFEHYQLGGARTYTEARTGGPDTAAPRDTTETRPTGTAPGAGGYDPAAATGDVQAATAPSETPDANRSEAPPAAGTTGYGAPAAEGAQTPPQTREDFGSDAQAPAADRRATDVNRSEAPPAAGTTGYGAPAAEGAQIPPQTREDFGSDAQAPATQRVTTDTNRDDARAASAAAESAQTPPQTREDFGSDAQAPATQRVTTDTNRDDARAATGVAAGGQTPPQTRPDLGAQQPGSGRGRLRKYVTTENVTKTVPVQREEVRIDREPITDENREEVLNRQGSDDERDVLLHEERLIVTKETVPVERVHIGTETVTEEVTVNEEVRKEHLGTEGAEGTERGKG